VNLHAHPVDVAATLLTRSDCRIQVAAVIVDRWGIFATGWNHMGADGFGCHAEAMALQRANRSRLRGATLLVASQRKRNQKMVCSKPCEACQELLRGRGLTVRYRDSDGIYRLLM